MSSANSDISFVALEDDTISIIDQRGGVKSDQHSSFKTTMSLVSKLIATVISVHVIYIAIDENTLFSLHPVCMTIGVCISTSNLMP
jgi:hypothetical protein